MSAPEPNLNAYPEQEDVIEFAQILEFLSTNVQKLVVAGFVGAVVGVGGWAVLAPYKAESVVTNTSAFNNGTFNNGTFNNGTFNNGSALTFLSWRALQKNLPILASELLEGHKIPAEQERVYRQLSDTKWFAKHVTPTYSLTKGDTKDLASISKELQESGGNNILNLVISVNGSSKEAAESTASHVTNFVKGGSAFLAIKDLVNRYESRLLNIDADIQKKILDTEVELKFMRQRADNLEALRQRFPSNVAGGSQQLMDLKDANAKFMPISTQLVAINTDINNTLEALERLNRQLVQSKVLRAYIAKITPVLKSETDGIQLVDTLLEIEGEMRAEVTATDINANQMLNDIEANLVSIRTSFTKGLSSELAPQVTHMGPLMPAVGGLFAGSVLMLLSLWVQGLYQTIRQRRAG